MYRFYWHPIPWLIRLIRKKQKMMLCELSHEISRFFLLAKDEIPLAFTGPKIVIVNSCSFDDIGLTTKSCSSFFRSTPQKKTRRSKFAVILFWLNSSTSQANSCKSTIAVEEQKNDQLPKMDGEIYLKWHATNVAPSSVSGGLLSMKASFEN